MKRLAHLFALLSLLCSALAHAHKPSDSYLSLSAGSDADRFEGQWAIAIRDLEHALGIDANGDGEITWRELHDRETGLAQYAFAHLSIERFANGGRTQCPIESRQMLVDEHVDGAYAVLRFAAACTAPVEALAIRYSLLFELDPAHRGLLDLNAGGQSQALVLSYDTPEQIANLASPNRWMQLRSFVHEGIWHILHGYDHILFLITLLLPAVVLFSNRAWQPRPSLRDAMLDVVKVVSAFTLAHSLTLSLAAIGAVSLPSRWVESTIAITVALGALNNLWPIVTQRRWVAAFVFGLIHGFGFASVLADLGLQEAGLALALFGFNLGVELGQLAIVLVLVPVAYRLRASSFYRRVFMPAGAVVITVLAAYWFVERAFPVTTSF